MNILWFTWKDKRHPLAGGAELVNEELAKRLVADGHEVIFIVGGFAGGAGEEIRDGFKIIRVGNRWTVYWHAFIYYRKNLKGWADLVIDEVNTIPFFFKFYDSRILNFITFNFKPSTPKCRNILFIDQLCRGIWFFQMFFPLNLVGYLLEPLYLRLLNDKKVITISESTKKDLIRYGFKTENIAIIPVGIEIEPVRELESFNVLKYKVPTILSLGSVRPMKRTLDIVKAFEIAKENLPDLELVIAGDTAGSYGQKVLDYIRNSRYSGSIQCLGKVDKMKKIELMQKAHLMAVTSVKEGWGLIVTEANSQGTPAVVYDVDGLRDAVKDGLTGLICGKNTPADLAEKIIRLMKDGQTYISLQKNAWDWSKEINFENSYHNFKNFITL